ncbi:hypothetical protein K474DRAFT_1704208 [Panus rudis PR-1116 ss-1]|nr:hypothetical protein K474DRAFT_1704208 [Panus rudis PR-1116 ss-1]
MDLGMTLSPSLQTDSQCSLLQVKQVPSEWKLCYDIFAYVLDHFVEDRKTMIRAMSTCHILRHAGVRPLLHHHCGSVNILATPSTLLSFCHFMVVDFPSRCVHLRKLDLQGPIAESDTIQSYDPMCLRLLGMFVACSPNITYLHIRSDCYKRMAEVSPEFHAALFAGYPSTLESLSVMLEEQSTPWMCHYLQQINPRSIRKLRLSLPTPDIWENIDSLTWQPCPHITTLELRHFHWNEIGLDWLVDTFPRIKVLDLYHWEEMDHNEFVVDRTDENLDTTSWRSLDRLSGDLNYVYGLGLTTMCDIRELDICLSFFSWETPRLIEVMNRMRVRSISFSIFFDVEDLGEVLNPLETCDLYHVYQFNALLDMFEDSSTRTSEESEDIIVRRSRVADTIHTTVEALQKQSPNVKDSAWEWALTNASPNVPHHMKFRLRGQRKATNGVEMPSMSLIESGEVVYWVYPDASQS